MRIPNTHPTSFYLYSSFFSFRTICLSIVSLEQDYTDCNFCCRSCFLLQAVIGRTLQVLIPFIYFIYLGFVQMSHMFFCGEQTLPSSSQCTQTEWISPWLQYHHGVSTSTQIWTRRDRMPLYNMLERPPFNMLRANCVSRSQGWLTARKYPKHPSIREHTSAILRQRKMTKMKTSFLLWRAFNHLIHDPILNSHCRRSSRSLSFPRSCIPVYSRGRAIYAPVFLSAEVVFGIPGAFLTST